MLGASVLWSTSGAFAKSLHLPPSVMACYRVLFAGLFLSLFLRRRDVRWRFAILGMAMCFAIMNASFVWAIVLTTAANAIFLQYTAPAWMLVFSVVFLHERLSLADVGVVAISLVGVGVILSGGGVDSWAGVGLALVAGVTYAAVAVFLRGLRGTSPVWLTTVNLLAGGLVLLPFAAWVDGPALVRLSWGQGLGLAAFGIAQMALPYLLFARGLSLVSAQEAGILTLAEPVLNPIVTFLAVGERPAPATIAGGALILGGLCARYAVPIARRFKKRKPSAEPRRPEPPPASVSGG